MSDKAKQQGGPNSTSANPGTEEISTPTVSIYQDAEHIAGLVQQLFNAPLITEGTREEAEDSSKSADVSAEITASGAGKVKAPFFGHAEGSAGAKGTLAGATAVSTGTKSTQNFVYSQAYYLTLVRSALLEQNLLRQVNNRADAERLVPGSFVEYQGDFSAHFITALVDVLTPDVILSITKTLVRQGGSSSLEGIVDQEQLQAEASRVEYAAQIRGEFAAEMTRAVKSDFRQDTTREYLGHIGGAEDPVTAVTICNDSSFTIADRDRILDGSFRVLGKVTSPVEDDVPVLQRNKLLGSLAPETVDGLFGAVDEMLGKATDEPLIEGMQPGPVLSVKLNSRIDGPSFRVIPIAIYI